MGVLTHEEQKLSDAAELFVKTHSKEIINQFAGNVTTEINAPTIIFTAGSPGAGKTEFANQFAAKFAQRGSNMVHIDADAIRNLLPGYIGGNSHVFQKAAVIGVQKLFDHVLHTRKNSVLDGTFSREDIAHMNIKRCIDHGAIIAIAYLYEDPLRAWEFTKAREIVEGRHIDKHLFIKQLFAAPEVVMKIKNDFGGAVHLWGVTKNFESKQFDINVNIQSVDEVGKIAYSKEQLETLLI